MGQSGRSIAGELAGNSPISQAILLIDLPLRLLFTCLRFLHSNNSNWGHSTSMLHTSPSVCNLYVAKGHAESERTLKKVNAAIDIYESESNQSQVHSYIIIVSRQLQSIGTGFFIAGTPATIIVKTVPLQSSAPGMAIFFQFCSIQFSDQKFVHLVTFFLQ